MVLGARCLAPELSSELSIHWLCDLGLCGSTLERVPMLSSLMGILHIADCYFGVEGLGSLLYLRIHSPFPFTCVCIIGYKNRI